MDGAAEGRGPDGGGGAGAAVEIDAADGLCGEEGPGVMRGGVGVVEGNAVEVDVVVAVGEAAEVGLGLAEADAVAGGGEGGGRHLDDFAVVGDGRGEVLDEGRGDEVRAEVASSDASMGASAAATEPTALASTVTCWETSPILSANERS